MMVKYNVWKHERLKEIGGETRLWKPETWEHDVKTIRQEKLRIVYRTDIVFEGGSFTEH